MTKVLRRNVMAAMLLWAATCGVFGEDTAAYVQQRPLKFAPTNGVVEKAGGLMLRNAFNQVSGQPLAMECERATQVSLTGAEIPLARADAGGGMALRHACGLVFDFESVDPGDYALRLRIWGPYCGPCYINVDGKAIPIESGASSTEKQWGWAKTAAFTLKPGAHHLGVGGDTIFWGVTLDRVVIAKADAPAPEGMGPAAVGGQGDGYAESDWCPADGVQRWMSLKSTVITNDGTVRWLARQETNAAWTAIAPNDVSSLDPHRPVQVRVELKANAVGASPWVEMPVVLMDGAPRIMNPAPGVTLEGTPDGGFKVTTTNYALTLSRLGDPARLTVGAHEVVVPLETNKVGTRTPFAVDRLLLQTDGTLVLRGGDGSIAWSFGQDYIQVYLAQSLTGSGFYTIPLQRTFERMVDRRSGRDIGKEAYGDNPQVFFADGASVGMNEGRAREINNLSASPSIGFWFNSANIWIKRFVLHAKPTIADALEMSATATPADFNFAAKDPVRLRFPTKLLYGVKFSGRAELTCEQWYADPPPAKVAMTQEVALSSAPLAISWDIALPKPGLYRATIRLFENDKAIRDTTCWLAYAMETVPPPLKPADFDAFWAKTMKQLAAMPRDFETLKTNDAPGTVIRTIRFKTIGDRPAWAYIRTPKAPGKYPAVIILPPVGTGASGGQELTNRVQMGIEIRGFDPTLPDKEAAEKAPVPYNAFEQPQTTTLDSLWIYQAYCTMMRAYDILESLPEVDPKHIYITGASQGGGLTLALASLRPQNAGALAIVPGLCRLDWRATNGGGWGPYPSKGPEFDRIAKLLGYFDDCSLVPRIRSRVAIVVGLLDDHTPPHAAINAYHQVGPAVDKRLVVNPWIGHSGKPEDGKILETWIETDKTAK